MTKKELIFFFCFFIFLFLVAFREPLGLTPPKKPQLYDIAVILGKNTAFSYSSVDGEKYRVLFILEILNSKQRISVVERDVKYDKYLKGDLVNVRKLPMAPWETESTWELLK